MMEWGGNQATEAPRGVIMSKVSFKLIIGSTDDFTSQDELLDMEMSGNRSTFEVELDSSTVVPHGFKSLKDFAQTILFGMAFQESWCDDDIIIHFDLVE
jgi:hypothetical protein